MDVRLNQYQPLIRHNSTATSVGRGTQSTQPVEAISPIAAIKSSNTKLEMQTEAQRIAGNGNDTRGQVLDIFV